MTALNEPESRLMKIYEDITFHDSKSSSLKRENANINGDTSMGSMLQMGSAGAKEYFLEHVLKPEHAVAHKSGDIHIHDLDFYTTTTTCTQIDLLKLFKDGFSTGHGILREPNDIQSYAALACIAIQSNQNDQHGGQSIVNFDYGLAPGVKKTFRKRYRENMVKAIGLKEVFPGVGYLKLDELSIQVEKTLAEKGLFIQYLEGSDQTPNKEYRDAEFETYGFDKNNLWKRFDELDRWVNEKECNQIEAFLACQHWAYAEAIYETERATYQAMEGLVHNLNTMHCLPASEKIWVKDETGVHLLSMKEIYETFVSGKYEVYSLNCKTGTTELKPITTVKEQGDHRDLVRLRTASGQSVVTTTNHRIPSYKDGDFQNIEAERVDSVVSPRAFPLMQTTESLEVKKYASVRKDSPFQGESIFVSAAFAELLGIYVGDGSVCGGSQMILSVAHKFDESFLDDLVSKALGFLPTKNITYYDGDKIREYRYNVGTRIANFLKDLCGANSYCKKVPSFLFESANELKTAFLKGYLLTDGCRGKKYVTASSVSDELISGCRLLFMQMKEFPTTGVRQEKNLRTIILGHMPSKRIGLPVAGKAKTEAPKYDLSFTSQDVKYVNRRSGNVCYHELLGAISGNPDLYEKYSMVMNFFVSPVTEKEFFNSGDEKVYDISVADNETFLTKDGIFVHNSRAGAQVPFSSINYGMDTSPEGRLVTRSVLLAHEAGLGGGETPIFPIHVFRVYDSVNGQKGDPNYDLFQLACRVSAKRLFPNFVFQDAPYNKAFYKGTPETECASMGCVNGAETIKYRIGKKFFAENFQKSWDRISQNFSVRQKGLTKYIDVENVDIYDSHTDGFVKVIRFIKNPDQGNWKEIVFSNGLALRVTSDHPLPVIEKGRTFVRDLKVGDKIPTARNELGILSRYSSIDVVSIKDLGSLNEDSYDVETESDYFDVSGIISHNCRTRVIANVHDPDKAISWSRGNLSFTSINLPRLAIKANGDNEKFIADLDSVMTLCIDQLLDRLEYQSRRKKKNFPFLMNGVWLDSETLGPEDEVREVLKHGTLSVGFIGLAEALVALTGKHHGESEEAQKLGLEIIAFMRKRLDEEAEKRKLNFSLLATPAEGLSGRFIALDKEQFGCVPGVTDREYYTNSFHVPVWYPISVAEKIRIEAPYHALCNAGHITYVELDGDVTQNVEAFEKIIQLMKTSGIGYGAINHPIDHDPVCGYNGIINGTCPKCGRKETNEKPFERIRRITGYLVGTLDRFNDAKRAEVADRIVHQL